MARHTRRAAAAARRHPFSLLGASLLGAAVALAAALAVGTPTGGATAAVAPANTALPTISGTAAVGQTLTANPGTWTGDQPIVYAYRWLRCNAAGNNCVDIPGGQANDRTYTVRNADARRAATATDSASLASFLFDRPEPRSRTRDANVAGTSITCSPTSTSCCASR